MSQDSPKKSIQIGAPPAGIELDVAAAPQLNVLRPIVAPQITSPTPPKKNSPNQINLNVTPRPQNFAQAQETERHLLTSADDEISTFFRNRKMIAQGSFGLNKYLKFAMTFFISVALYMIIWNHSEPVRSYSQKFIFENCEINLSEYIPAWSRRAKSFARKVALTFDEQSRQVSAVKAAASYGPLDPLFVSISGGFWPHVESILSSKCQRWQATHDCGVKSFLLSYRGQKGSLRPLQNLDVSEKSGLSPRDQALFLYAKSESLVGPESSVLFYRALDLLGKDLELQKILIDAKFKSTVVGGKQDEIAHLIHGISNYRMPSNLLSKWRAMESARRAVSLQANADARRAITKQVSEALAGEASLFKLDPSGFCIVGTAALQLGLSKQVAATASNLLANTGNNRFDRDLRREINIIYARAMMMEGSSAQAADRLRLLHKTDGIDPVSAHILGSIYLDMRNTNRNIDAIALFKKAIEGRPNWQSEIGLLTALTRAGRLQEANKIANSLTAKKASNQKVWEILAVSELKLALAKSNGDLSFEKYNQVAEAMSGIHAQYPAWPNVAKIYAEALANSGQLARAQKVIAKLDDVSSKTSYVLSSEYRDSPLGPFALLK